MKNEQNFEAGVHRDYGLGEDGRVHPEAQRHKAHLLLRTHTEFQRIARGEGSLRTDGQAQPGTGLSPATAGEL